MYTLDAKETGLKVAHPKQFEIQSNVGLMFSSTANHNCFYIGNVMGKTIYPDLNPHIYAFCLFIFPFV